MIPTLQAFWATVFTLLCCAGVAAWGISHQTPGLFEIIGAVSLPLAWYMGRNTATMFARAKDNSGMDAQIRAEADAVVKVAEAKNGNGGAKP
jgi:hypothetical protein